MSVPKFGAPSRDKAFQVTVGFRCKPAFRCNSTTGAHTFSSATTSFLIVVVAAAAAAVVVVVFKFFSIFFLN